MTDLQLHIKPCPYCGRPASIERALYYQDGTQIPKDAPHDMWLAKCSECGARTEYMPTRLSAIIAWNRGQFNGLTKILNLEHGTKNPDPWYKLRDAIILVQTEDLKAEAIKREARRAAGGRVGSKLESESWFYSSGYERLGGPDGAAVVRGIKAQAPYLYWKERMDCAHCAVKESECPHKRDNSEWRAFNKGIARGCVKREGGD